MNCRIPNSMWTMMKAAYEVRVLRNPKWYGCQSHSTMIYPSLSVRKGAHNYSTSSLVGMVAWWHQTDTTGQNAITTFLRLTTNDSEHLQIFA
jgi:hypothetical protein